MSAAPFCTHRGSTMDDCKALVGMGRPLWTTVAKSKRDLVTFAADQLLLGLAHARPGSYTSQTMFGVRSMLCCLGVHPQASSGFASRAVADLMAMLAYASDAGDTSICRYSTEPVLALGAAKLWKTLLCEMAGDNVTTALARHVLPESRKLKAYEVVATCDAGDLVARILLLLATERQQVGECDCAARHAVRLGYWRRRQCGRVRCHAGQVGRLARGL